MAMFRYEAADVGGREMRGAMEALTADEVRANLQARGLRPVSVTASHPVPAAAPKVGGLRRAARSEDLARFFRQFGALLNAGYSPSTALADLGPRTGNPELGSAALAVAADTARGGSLAGAMARTNGIFPPHVVGLLSAGEAGGFLPFACEEAALGAEQDVALRQGMWWPRLLIWQAIWSVLFLQPLFPSFDFKDADHVLANSALNYGKMLLFVAVPIGLLLHAIVFFGERWLATASGAPTRDRWMLKFPVTRRLANDRALASFTRVLRRLLAAGLSPEIAFAGAAEAAPNGVIREKLRRGVPILRGAGGLDAAVQATGMIDYDSLQLLVTGQRTGTWTESLDQVAAFYQERAAQATEAARAFQKRAGILITIVSMGYVTIEVTRGWFKMALDFAGSIAPDSGTE